MALPDGVRQFNGRPSNPAKPGSEGGSQAAIGSASKAGERNVQPDIATFDGSANRGTKAARTFQSGGFRAQASRGAEACPDVVYVQAGKGMTASPGGSDNG